MHCDLYYSLLITRGGPLRVKFKKRIHMAVLGTVDMLVMSQTTIILEGNVLEPRLARIEDQVLLKHRQTTTRRHTTRPYHRNVLSVLLLEKF